MLVMMRFCFNTISSPAGGWDSGAVDSSGAAVPGADEVSGAAVFGVSVTVVPGSCGSFSFLSHAQNTRTIASAIRIQMAARSFFMIIPPVIMLQYPDILMNNEKRILDKTEISTLRGKFT
jgi:hypothetical protein